MISFTREGRLLACASGGGHWIELLRLHPVFAEWDTAYVSTFESHSEAVPGRRLYTLPDATRFDLAAFPVVAWKALGIVLRERPCAVVTTGSAPMLFILLFARLLGARTLWIDSIAQPNELATSARIARRFAHKVVAQWPEAAAKDGVEHWGAVL
ncbi:hypothetical protein [Sphingomonas sp.]|uniref:hypothetical protein n=1 Tax=Sphingomonas sp. TaxID=28214 RepID=UPI0031E34A49